MKISIMKVTVLALAIASMGSIITQTFAEDINYVFKDITIIINGNELYSDKRPVIINDTTYVPLRAIAEGFGKNVIWDGENNRILIGDNYIERSFEENNGDSFLSVNVNSTITSPNINATLNSLKVNDYGTEIDVTIENKSSYTFKILQDYLYINQEDNRFEKKTDQLWNISNDYLNGLDFLEEEIPAGSVRRGHILFEQIDIFKNHAEFIIGGSLNKGCPIQKFRFNVNWNAKN